MPEIVFDEEYQNGQLVRRVERTVPDSALRARAAQTRLTQGRAALRQIRTQAQTASDATGALTLAQLTTQFRQLAGATATLTQTLMDIELILAFQQDDGTE